MTEILSMTFIGPPEVDTVHQKLNILTFFIGFCSCDRFIYPRAGRAGPPVVLTVDCLARQQVALTSPASSWVVETVIRAKTYEELTT
jgi:hypothetical protein